VLDYGADPTNSNDSTDAIRDTIEAARAWQEANAGGLVTVYFPTGIYSAWSIGPGSEADRIIFLLYFGNLVLEGDGPTESIINCRAWAGQDPMLEISNRGILFSTLNTPTPIDGITIRGLRCTGNASPTDFAGMWWVDDSIGLDQSTVGWDIQHKGVGVWGEVTNFKVEFCEWDNWRGEVIYSGGGSELGNMTVENCIVRGSNASAISMGGYVVVDNVWIKAVYNGTECFSLTAGQGLEVTNCVINPNDGLPAGVRDIGVFGVVYLGVSTASLTVTGNDIGKTNSGGVFLSEAASNVVISNNDFTDTIAIYSIYLGQYPNEPNFQGSEPNRYINHVYANNTVTADTQDVPDVILSYTNPNNQSDWEIDGWTLIEQNGFAIERFIQAQGCDAPFIVTDNTIPDGCTPAALGTGMRPTVWTGNTITGYHADGQARFDYNPDTTPISYTPSWPKLAYIEIGGAITRRLEIDGADTLTLGTNGLTTLPTGFPLEIRRTDQGPAHRGVEIQPEPAWNSLVRGYMLFEGAVLTITKTSAGVMELTSYTPSTENLRTLSEVATTGQAATDMIMFFGQLSVTLSPTVAHTYDTFSGIAIGETVTINHNGNVTITHTPGVIEMASGVDFVASGSGSLTATRHQDGTLLVGSHTFAEDAPIIGLRQTGDVSDNVYGMELVLVQDGDNPSATDGYYSIERKLEAGAWAEIVQVPKASVTGTRKTYTYTDTDLSHLNRGEEYSYRARAVSPGTPDVVSRWSNTATKTFVDYVGTLQLRTEVYKTASSQDLEMDIYRPNNALTGRTAVICVHGGGWTSSSRAVHAAHCAHFAEEGFVAFNIDYRLDDGTDDMEDQVKDVRAAIRWVRENAVEYGVDPDDIVILGESAGGHLAGCAAFIDDFDDAGGDQLVSSRPNRAVLINPITYLPGIPWYEGNAAQVGTTPVPDDTTQLTPADTGADLSLRLSPQLYADITPGPDVLFIHGDDDSVVPFAQSEDMHDLLVLAGNTSTLETMVGSEHSFFLPGIGSESEINATLAIIDDFLSPP
jgi:acetyl esterase/lipase